MAYSPEIRYRAQALRARQTALDIQATGPAISDSAKVWRLREVLELDVATFELQVAMARDWHERDRLRVGRKIPARIERELRELEAEIPPMRREIQELLDRIQS